MKCTGAAGKSDDVDSHTKNESIKVHYAAIDEHNNFLKEDKWIDLQDEPVYQELCIREQRYFLRAIKENIDLKDDYDDAYYNLKIVFA